MNIIVTLDKHTWRSGADILDVKVVLGQMEKSSTCSVTLADPSHVIASALINHSLSTGGIVALPGDTETSEGGLVPPGFVPATTGSQPTLRKAFLDTIAYSEGTWGNGDDGYNVIVGGSTFSGYAAHPNVAIPIPRYGIRSTAAGRYQFLNTTWFGLRDKLKLPDFGKDSQDKAAIELVRGAGALGYVDKGNIASAFASCHAIWASFPGSSLGQQTQHFSNLKAFYDKRLVALGAAPGLPNTTKEQPKPVASTTASEPIIKGNKLTITVDETVFEFFHQGTETLSDGKTTLTGQGIRYVLSRRKRNKTIGQTSLKALATAIATAHRVKLDYQASTDFQYQHLDQTGISDYELLLRECRQAGLFVSEASGTLTIKALANVRDSQFVVAEGLNLLSWTIKDEAIDSSKDDDGSGLLQGEDKVSLNPITGQFEQSKPDIDPVKDASVTGKASKKAEGTLEPGQEALAAQSRSRVKRVKGLPSSFTIVLTEATLGLKPLDAIRTIGLPGVLSRVWMVDTVSHEIAAGKTILSCYSPIEVLDTSPQPSNTSTTSSSPSTASVVPSTGWIIPLGGQVTSLYGMRTRNGRTRHHDGVDISSVGGTGAGGNVVASASGIVGYSGFKGGYGNTVDIKHPNGWMTRYAHLHSLKVRLGETVTQGQLIGIEGSTGGNYGTHLHFEIHDTSGHHVNPANQGLPSLANKGSQSK